MQSQLNIFSYARCNLNRYVPQIPFDGYKWLFATKAPTESLGDPAVLLGLVRRMSKIEDGITRYSSAKFSTVLQSLDRDIKTTVDLSRRTGERNLMRNSGQYWKLFGLIPQQTTHGIITLTPLARRIATGDISQFDFSACMIVTTSLPNKTSYSKEMIKRWNQHGLTIHPFKLILEIIRELNTSRCGWLTIDELANVVVPMAGDKQNSHKIAEYILKYREDTAVIDGWPKVATRSNDQRFLDEYLRFLSNFGYLNKVESINGIALRRDTVRYSYIDDIDYQIEELITGRWSETSPDLIDLIKASDISSSISMSGIVRRNVRPGQQKFRASILNSIKACPITGVDLPAVLQAAHIKPYSFGGTQEADNGLPLRADIHCLFDAGLLNIRPIGRGRMCSIELSSENVKNNYRELNGKFIEMPQITNMDYVEWRYNNSLLGVA